MKGYQRIFIFLLLVLLLTCLLSPWVAAFWEWTLQQQPEWQEFRYPFSRIFDRFFMITGIILFFIYRPVLKIGSAAQLGLQPFPEGYRDLLCGFFIAISSMVALGAAMSWLDVFTPYFRLPFAESLERSVKGLLTAFTVGFLEEIFFRGIIFKGLLEDFKALRAFIFASLFYSAIHFVKPSEKVYLEGIDPWAGFQHLASTFEAFLDPLGLLPGLFGLFLIGLVLSYAFLRTGSLYLSIGLHAGWIFSLKTIRVFGEYQREDLGWLFGSLDPKLVSGVAGWIGIIAVGVVVHRMTLTRPRLSAAPPPPEAIARR